MITFKKILVTPFLSPSPPTPQLILVEGHFMLYYMKFSEQNNMFVRLSFAKLACKLACWLKDCIS